MSAELRTTQDVLWLIGLVTLSLIPAAAWWHAEVPETNLMLPSDGFLGEHAPWSGPLNAKGCWQILHSDDRQMHEAALIRLSVLREEDLARTWWTLATLVTFPGDRAARAGADRIAETRWDLPSFARGHVLQLARNLVSLAPFVEKHSGERLLSGALSTGAATGSSVDRHSAPRTMSGTLELATALMLERNTAAWSQLAASAGAATCAAAFALLPVPRLTAPQKRGLALAALQTAREHRDRRLLQVLAALPVSAVPVGSRGELVFRMVAELSQRADAEPPVWQRSAAQRRPPGDQELANACRRLVTHMDANRRQRLESRLRELGF